MERHEATDGSDQPATWSDEVLIARLRGGDRAASERAATELWGRYRLLLVEEARRRRVPPPLDGELAAEALGAALRLWREGAAAIPDKVPGYLVAAVRRRALNLHRAARRAAVREAALAAELPDRVLPDESPAPAASPLAALAAHLDAHLDDDERRLLLWLGDHVPQREMAEWLGASHGAVRTRVSRLRQRLRALAHAFAPTRAPHERLAIERFLQRVAPVPAPGPGAPTSTARASRGRSHGPST